MHERIECPECGGEGEYDVFASDLVRATTISPPYRRVSCRRCGGSGEIDPDEEWYDE